MEEDSPKVLKSVRLGLLASRFLLDVVESEPKFQSNESKLHIDTAKVHYNQLFLMKQLFNNYIRWYLLINLLFFVFFFLNLLIFINKFIKNIMKIIYLVLFVEI